MSLSDLKKKDSSQVKKQTFTVDEFIEDAENYAQGSPEIVSGEHNHSMSLKEAISAAKKIKQDANNKHVKPYRHATFTLSEEAINELNELAQESKLAKSHIIRILIMELCNEEQKEKLSRLIESDTS